MLVLEAVLYCYYGQQSLQAYYLDCRLGSVLIVRQYNWVRVE